MRAPYAVRMWNARMTETESIWNMDKKNKRKGMSLKLAGPLEKN